MRYGLFTLRNLIKKKVS